MTPEPSPDRSLDWADLSLTLEKVNKALLQYCDKDWNYSRISLHTRPLESITGPYALWIDLMQTKTKQGQADLKTSKSEIAWGQHHSNELGILEIISLRINRALLESTTDESWEFQRPIVLLKSKEELVQKGITDALWYEVVEVAGQDFDNR
jgi:hypothetical protein